MSAEVYLFTGPELGDKNEVIEKLLNDARQKNSDLELYKYFSSDVRVSELVSQLQNMSLFSSALFVVYRNAEQIKQKSDIELLASYIKGAANSPNTLILTSDETSVDKKLESLIEKDHKKIFWEMFDNRKPAWVKDFFRRNGYSVTDDAVDQILEMVENNTETLKNECSRFFYCFEKGHKVDTSDVDKILSHNRAETPFSLFDAMSDKTRAPKQRLETSLGILQKILMLGSSESSATKIISGLTYCFRQLRTWHNLHADKKTPTEAQLLSAGFSKKKRVGYEMASSIWGAGATASILALLSDTDMASRESGKALDETRLTLLLYSIIIKNGLYCAAYEEN